MTPFGNEDPIDKRNREGIRSLRIRNRELKTGFKTLVAAFERSTSMTQGEKEQTILEAKRVLNA